VCNCLGLPCSSYRLLYQEPSDWCGANWLRAFHADHREKRVWFPAEPPAEHAEEAEPVPLLHPWGCPPPPPPPPPSYNIGSQRDLDKALVNHLYIFLTKPVHYNTYWTKYCLCADLVMAPCVSWYSRHHLKSRFLLFTIAD